MTSTKTNSQNNWVPVTAMNLSMVVNEYFGRINLLLFCYVGKLKSKGDLLNRWRIVLIK